MIKEALAIAERTAGADSSETAEVLIAFAAIDRERHRSADGQTKLERALAARERRGKDQPSVADCHTELGRIDQAQGNAADRCRHPLALNFFSQSGTRFS